MNFGRKTVNADISSIKKEIEAGDAQLVDVREPAEWEAGHLKVAISAPLSQLSTQISPTGIDKEVRLYLHCAAGLRTAPAKRELEKMGYGDVIALKDGFVDLVRGGFETA